MCILIPIEDKYEHVARSRDEGRLVFLFLLPIAVAAAAVQFDVINSDTSTQTSSFSARLALRQSQQDFAVN